MKAYDENKKHIRQPEDQKILPPLPKEFDRFFVVDRSAGSIDISLLRRSGYSFSRWNRFAGLPKGATYLKWQLNPHTKCCHDAAPREAEAISFREYLSLFADKK